MGSATSFKTMVLVSQALAWLGVGEIGHGGSEKEWNEEHWDKGQRGPAEDKAVLRQ